METKNQQNSFNNPVAIIIFIALLGLGGYFLFSKNSSDTTATTTQNSDTQKTITEAYTNTTANVRECGSSTCKVVGTYDPNTSVDVSSYSIGNVSQLPDWISFSYPSSDGSSATGYINKSVLSDTQVSVESKPAVTQTHTVSNQNPTKSNLDTGFNQNNVQTQTQQTYSAETLASDLAPRLAYVTCNWYNRYGSVLFTKSFNGLLGQYTSSGGMGSYYINTVRDGITDTQWAGYLILPSSCDISFPSGASMYAGGLSTFSVGSSGGGDAVVNLVSNAGVDFGQVVIKYGNNYLATYAKTNNYCASRPSVGDAIAVIGWPINSTGQTLTGTVTGTSGYYDTTSISIPNGMQGSTAVSVTHGCILGQTNSAGQIADESALKYVFGL
ncbi:MAG: hypothetical protein NT077_01310 [Candidatus Taylorbacteria bacterium]|nr:hypothetical protein [Candidatus Taylorbacteria bacterium]